MPQAVTHFLIPAILVALFRDFYLRKRERKEFPLHYVLIAGLAGLILDLDYILQFITGSPHHRIFFHNIYVPLIFIFLGILFLGIKNKELGKHKLRLSTIFFIIGFSVITHLILDGLVDGQIYLFYPLIKTSIGLNLVDRLPEFLQEPIVPIIDAVLLVFWMFWLEWKHKISDFI